MSMVDTAEIERMVGEVCESILAHARPELQRLDEMAHRYADRPIAYREYRERYAELYRATIDQLAAARKPLVDLAMYEPMTILVRGGMIDAALGKGGE